MKSKFWVLWFGGLFPEIRMFQSSESSKRGEDGISMYIIEFIFSSGDSCIEWENVFVFWLVFAFVFLFLV